MSTNTASLTGYHREDTFFASRKFMGGRPVYHLDMPISQLTAGVDAPPVDEVQEDNRIVKLERGKAFADYVNEKKEWASPSLLLWCPLDILKFEPRPEINEMVNDPSVILGVLSVPRSSKQSVKILDGQHRILGFHLWMQQLNKELQAAKLNYSEAKKLSDPIIEEAARVRVEKAEENMARSENESIGIDILICSSAKEARQIFADIANNAKGMVKALAIGFDQTKVVNRITSVLADEKAHPLLADRIDFNKDRVSGASDYLLSAKTLADSIRCIAVGITGRISKAQERDWQDGTEGQGLLEYKTRQFFDALQNCFERDFAMEPKDMRDKSLLGSGTIVRVFAGVWFELTSDMDSQGKKIKPRKTVKEATEFFAKLQPFMAIPIKSGNPWLTTGVFPSPERGQTVTAPGSRNQELKSLTVEITNWAINPSSFPFGK